ncbi:hypothetical protein SH1V18_11900 [Vallitalea longa]|uniref:Uncharacterized protein n=1 Tax=Vallitalea longa TaxID=2936439 RepID=A0A9W6DDT7_9FIRM|nr:hypothetical protein [Vallitalea longa]GKX28710.1 hypothetical protein SH1V18_11900 [Vallitalea longa]
MNLNMTILYYCIIIILLYASWLIFRGIKKHKYKYTFRKPKANYLKYKNTKDEINDAFNSAGANITIDKYNNIRLIILIVAVVIMSVSYDTKKLPFILVILLTCYIILTPVKKFGKKDSPFMIIIKMISKMQNKKKDIEIYRLLIQIKNIAITRQVKPYSADYTINQLIKFSKLTKNALINFLILYDVGKEDEAYKKFTKEINTKMGNDFAMILLKLDKLNPLELVEQINIIKDKNREEHITEKHRKQNTISDLIYFPIIIPVFILFLNFIMVTIWIPRIESMMFFE